MLRSSERREIDEAMFAVRDCVVGTSPLFELPPLMLREQTSVGWTLWQMASDGESLHGYLMWPEKSSATPPTHYAP